MKKYLSFFRLRFVMGLQYRAAALAGMVTQFFWGFMELMIFRAFYRADAAAFPMTFSATASYLWLQQAFLALFGAWLLENEIFDTIMNGNIAYELCRPIQVYDMWYARSIAKRLSEATLRCVPILVVAALLPEPYGLAAPASFPHFLMFAITLALGVAVTVAFTMLIYVLTFFVVSPQGLRIFFTSATELLAGAVIPLPFFPEGIRKVIELLPFASMQNVPLRVYSGDLSGVEMGRAVFFQIFWLGALVLMGKLLCRTALRRVTVQGG